MIRPFSLTALALLLVASAGTVCAQSPAEKGLQIANEAEERDSGFGSYAVNGEMVLRDRRGAESLRRFTAQVLEVGGDGDKSMIVFEWPRDIAQTGLLTFAHKSGDDDQWLYLPALRRVKRISSSGRSGSFVGSEFTYEDLSSPEVEKYSHEWQRDEPCPGSPALSCFVVARMPKSTSSGYSRELVWLDQEHYRIHQVEYYDRKGAHLKTLVAAGYQQYDGKYWRPAELTMTNHQNGKSTVMRWSDYDFTVALRDDEFTTRALERSP
jgi:outer membrane lipoprotein-sorting protein